MKKDKSDKKSRVDRGISVAAAVAIEDIVRGDYVAPHLEVLEFLVPSWCGETAIGRPRGIDVMTVACRPDDAGSPLKVVDVCAPYVVVRTARGDGRTIDTRQHRLVRLDPAYGRRAFKALRPRPDLDALRAERKRKRRKKRRRKRKS